MTKTLNQLTEITTLADDDLLLARDVSSVEDKRITVADLQAGSAKLSGGADANFAAMPLVGGDPIVESGSNSDGEWTRWADGTAVATAETTLEQTGANRLLKSNPELPTTFLSGEPRAVFITGSTIDSDFVNIGTTEVTLGIRNSDGTEVGFRHTADTSDATMLAYIFVIGRWK